MLGMEATWTIAGPCKSEIRDKQASGLRRVCSLLASRYGLPGLVGLGKLTTWKHAIQS